MTADVKGCTCLTIKRGGVLRVLVETRNGASLAIKGGGVLRVLVETRSEASLEPVESRWSSPKLPNIAVKLPRLMFARLLFADCVGCCCGTGTKVW